MDIKALNWENAHNLEDHFISYFLYCEGKSIKSISIIRKMKVQEIEKQIIKSKLELKLGEETEDLLIKIISLDKKRRIEYIKDLTNEERDFLVNDIYKRYISFKNHEDRVILIWLIGELKSTKLLPILRMELKSNNVNYKRIAASALGKIKDKSSKDWLEEVLEDRNPQVRQYAIKSLSSIGDGRTITLLKKILDSINEKEYVKRAAEEAIKSITG